MAIAEQRDEQCVDKVTLTDNDAVHAIHQVSDKSALLLNKNVQLANIY